ncbi:MAG TPA: histidine kinase, partial [Geobacter sp.]|nr:histidine kinase [Geobacter sp.]
TERKRAETELHNYRVHLEQLVQVRTAELERANVRLQEMDRLKSMFIASTSHELRTPLNAIIGFTGMTLQGLSGGLNEEQHDNLARVYRSAKHLLALITDIIDISKIEAGKISIFPEEFPLEELVDEAIAIVTPQLQEKGLSLERVLPAALTLYADRKRLLQCLVNLLSNAAKFTEKGRIVVAARESEGSIELSVTDSGIGIAEGDLPRLFKPFERLESHLRVQAGGTGLGLYLTAKLAADVLRGTISAQSREGEGSTFTLSLPRDLRRVPEPPDLGREGGGTP